MDNNFSKNLKKFRKRKKLTQLQLAKKIKVDRSTIAYWELGKNDPTLSNLIKLTEALEVDLITLIEN